MRLFIFLLVMMTALAAESEYPNPGVVRVVGFEYPRQAHMASVQGVIQLMLQIGEEGAVKSVEILSGNGLLAGPAAEALKKWRFTPCKGTAIDCRYPISVEFVLKGGPVDISQSKNEFEFEVPGRIIVKSQLAKAIVN